MYEFDARIRYSEVDSQRNLTWISLLNYFQDSSIFHSEECNVGMSFLKERNLAWVLNSWQIDVIRFPKLCEEVKVGTIPYEIKGFLGARNFYMNDATGKERLAVANSLWTLIDLDTMRPARVLEEIISAYEIQEKLDMEYTDRKIRFVSEGEEKGEIRVKKHHLDTNNHVNNGQYVKMAMDFLPQGFEVKRLRVEYKKQAVLSDVMLPVVYAGEKSFGVEFKASDGTVYANVEFGNR